MKRFRRCLLLLALSVAGALLPAAAPAQDLFVQANYGPQQGGTLRYEGPLGSAPGAPRPSEGNTGAVFVPEESGHNPAIPPSITFGPDGNLYVANWQAYSIERYNAQTGAFIDTFITPGSGRLNYPQNLHFGPDGNLYVASNAVIGVDSLYNSIDRYDGKTGAPLPSGTNLGAIFIPGLSLGSPDQTIVPADFAFRSGGEGLDLYVLDQYPDFVNNLPPRLVRYNGATGDFIASFSLPAGAYTNAPASTSLLAVGPDDNLYISTDQAGVLRYDLSTQLWDTFVPAGSGGISNGYGLAFGPDGNLYVTGAGADGLWRISRYNATTGNFVDTFVPAGSGAMSAAFGLSFGPAPGLGEDPDVIPEPGTLALLAGATVPALGLALRRRVKPWPAGRPTKHRRAL